jgi:hypothetical protein
MRRAVFRGGVCDGGGRRSERSPLDRLIAPRGGTQRYAPAAHRDAQRGPERGRGARRGPSTWNAQCDRARRPGACDRPGAAHVAWKRTRRETVAFSRRRARVCSSALYDIHKSCPFGVDRRASPAGAARVTTARWPHKHLAGVPSPPARGPAAAHARMIETGLDSGDVGDALGRLEFLKISRPAARWNPASRPRVGVQPHAAA